MNNYITKAVDKNRKKPEEVLLRQKDPICESKTFF